MLSYAHMVILLKIMIDKTDKLERIKKELSEVPTLPGVYLWKDAQGEVIYVGKAKQLRARMRQYVNFADDRAKIPMLVDKIESLSISSRKTSMNL